MSERDDTAACCPMCGAVGAIGSPGGWWFYCARCQWRWGHPQAYTLDTAQDAIVAALEKDEDMR